MSSIIRVFLDCEFTDFVNQELISIGLVTQNGEEFYGENLSFNPQHSSEFVKDIVYPLLNIPKYGMKRERLAVELWKWLDELPYDQIIITIDYQKDYELMLELLSEPHPKFYLVQNLYRIIEMEAIIKLGPTHPDLIKVITDAKEVFEKEFDRYFVETKEIQHHALSDAKANKRGFNAAEQLIKNKIV